MTEERQTVIKPNISSWQHAGEPLAGGSEPPHDGGMEDLLRRVGNLEQSGTQIRERLSTIEERLSHTATKAWVMGGAIVVLIAILGGFWWMAQQYLGPILRHLPH